MSRARRAALTSVVLVTLALVAALIVGVEAVRRPWPQTDGTAQIDALDGPVEVYRDAFGVAHVYADTTEGLFAAQGFVHAQDRFCEMDVRAALVDAHRELSDVLGPDPGAWRWGQLHTLNLRHPTLGSSGIGPIERLFNRGPVGVGGGPALVDATGWTASAGYQVDLGALHANGRGSVELRRVEVDRADGCVRTRILTALHRPGAALGGGGDDPDAVEPLDRVRGRDPAPDPAARRAVGAVLTPAPDASSSARPLAMDVRSRG